MRALETDHNVDFTKSVGELIGIYRVDCADYSKYSGKNITLCGKQIPFTPRMKWKPKAGSSRQDEAKRNTRSVKEKEGT